MVHVARRAGLVAVLAPLLLATFALAGCVEGDSAASPFLEAFDGTGPGMREHDVTCGTGDPLLRWRASSSGLLTVRVQDPSGVTAYVKAHQNGTEIDDEKRLTGPPGAWHVVVSRGSDFTGDYALTLVC